MIQKRTVSLQKYFCVFQSGHKLGKHGKPGKHGEYEKLSKSQGILWEIFIFVGIPGKLKKLQVCEIVADENVLQQTFLSCVSQGKF